MNEIIKQAGKVEVNLAPLLMIIGAAMAAGIDSDLETLFEALIRPYE